MRTVAASDNRYIDALVKRVRDRQLIGRSTSLRMGRTAQAPHVFAPIASQPETQPIGPTFLALRLGTKEVFGREATWADLLDRMRGYTLAQILHVASWVSATLPRSRADLRRQIDITLAFFGPAETERIMRVVAEHLVVARREGETRPLAVLFDELQVINLVKVAFLVLPPKSGVVRTNSLAALGEALLMVGELIESGPDSVGELYDRGDDEGRERARYGVFVNTLFHTGQNDFHVLARSYDLFLTDQPHLWGRGYVDLPRLVKKRTGLQPDQLWAVLFALFGHTFTHAAQPGPPIRIETYFRQQFRFTAAESRRFFRLVGQSATAIKQRVRAYYSEQDLKPYHVLPLAESPLVLLAGGGYVPSQTLLFAALTTGLYHRLLNAQESKAERSRFQEYVGRVFEGYVSRLLDRACAAATGGLQIRYIDGDTIRRLLPGTKKRKPKVCDGLAVSGDTIILFESKAKLFSLAVRSGVGFPEFRKKLDEILVGSAAQMDDTIQAIERGDLRSIGIDPAAIRRYLPVVVTLENLALTPLIFDPAVQSIADKGWLHARSSKTALIQLMEVGELELFEVAIRTGRNVTHLIEQKVRLAPAHSFTNFWHLEKESALLSARNSYLEGIYRSATDRAVAFFRSRAVQDQMRSGAAPGLVKSESDQK